MQCPSCGAVRAQDAITACKVCGHAFDLDVTGATPLPGGSAGVAADETRLGGAPPSAETRLTPVSRRAPASPPALLEVGAGFGERYHIIKLLGMGGMGAVYQVWDAELEVAVALKVIRPDYAADPESAAELERRFKRELLLARQVTHPNVVRIHDLGEVDGIKYLTMPYVHGKDLAAIIDERGALPVQEALPIASQIANGLVAAHHAGVVHRDLKPANILIDADRHALITDFGIARATAAPEIGTPGVPRGIGAMNHNAAGMTQVGTVMGSIEYMAPEQARGEAVDHRADIYAFGLILYRMLAGPSPANPAGPLAALQARMEAEPRRLREINSALPEAVESLVSRCLQPDPAARFQTTQELVAALNRLDADGNPVPLPVQLLKSVRFWIAAISAAAAIVGTTLFLASRPPPRMPDPVAILVADFSNQTGDPVFDGLLEQAVTVGVEGASFITAMPRGKAVETAHLIKAGDRLDEPAARLVALREGIKVVLVGGIEKRGSGYRLSIQGVDPSSRKVLFGSTEDARDRAAVLKAGGRLAAEVRAALGDTRAVDPRETLSTASLEAANAYTQAQQLSAAGKDQEAIEYFRRAVALDAGFGRAYGGMAMSATRLGRRDEASGLWKEALKHTDVMSEREKYRLLGAYYTLVTRNFAEALETYKKLVEQYPADGAGHNNLAVSYFRALRFNDALNEGRALRQIYPNSPLYRTNYALYAMYAGNFPLATQEATKVVDEGLAAYDTFLPIAVGAIASDNVQAARDAYTRMAAIDEAGASLAATGRADLALAQGLAGEAVTILEAGIKADADRKNESGVAVKEIELADALGMQRNVNGAVAAARRALAIDKTEAQIVPAVRWLIAANQVDEAARLGELLDNRLEAQARAYGRVVAAQVARARGRHIEAVDALRAALKLADLWLVRFNLGQAYLDAGAPAEALSEFEACQKRRGEGYAAFLDDIPTARDVAPISYWMGRAHEGMGLTPQARRDYERFMTAYAPGSPEPLLADTVRRLQALR